MLPVGTRNFIGLILSLILIFLGSIARAASPEQIWVARYNSPVGNGDEALAIAVDLAGNVYIAGRSYLGSGHNWDFFTVKYDLSGNTLWTANYNGTGNQDDIAYDIAVDNLGYVYVAGVSEGIGSGLDYATVKYDSNGTELWVARYNIANGRDEVRALALDDFGNAYVTGFGWNDDTPPDFTTVKYDTNGNELWAARYDGPQGMEDEAYALAVDKSGNVYVTGKSLNEWGEDYTVIKYDSHGNELWIARPSDPNIEFNEGRAIAVDNTGNVYVTGRCVDTRFGGYLDKFATIKYNPNGNEIWRVFGIDSSLYSVPCDLAIDSSGNVYVTGDIWSYTEFYNYAIVKYDPNGNELWAAQYDSGSVENNKISDNTSAIAVDVLGNVYITGTANPQNSSEDYLTISYSPSGELRWARRYYDISNRDFAYDLAVDNRGNVYVTGQSGNITPSEDAITIKYTEHDYCTGPIEKDLNIDCRINFSDYAILAQDWLPGNNWEDLKTLANNWLECNFALEADCW